MMGPRQVAQGALFYEFSIEDHVPPDHLLRGIDRFVDLGDMRRHLAPFYSSTGRPSVDPELMIRMLIVGYAFGIRSERRLCEEVHLNLAYRWFCRLDLTGPVPDHSTFSKNRHGRFRDSDLFRHLFESVVARCIAEGLVGGETFASDASLIRADANKQYAAPQADWHPDRIDAQAAPRAVREYLDVHAKENEPAAELRSREDLLWGCVLLGDHTLAGDVDLSVLASSSELTGSGSQVAGSPPLVIRQISHEKCRESRPVLASGSNQPFAAWRSYDCFADEAARCNRGMCHRPDYHPPRSTSLQRSSASQKR